MRNLFSFITIFGLLGLVFCQTYVDVHVCNGFDNSSPVQATITTTSTWAKNISFAQCADFTGVTTITGSMAATFDIVLYTPTGPSPTIRSMGVAKTLLTNSGQNVFVVWGTTGNANIQLTQIFTTADPRATGNQALYVGGDFTQDLNQVNITVPRIGSVGVFNSGQYGTATTAVLGPILTNQDPHTTVVGYYQNVTSGVQIQKSLSFPVGTGPFVMINTWPGSTYYALLCGSIGADLSGLGYRILGGSNGVNGYGIAFNSTGSAPLQYSSTGPASNMSSTGPGGNGAQGTVDAVSPLIFILAALFAIFATQF